MNAEFRNRQLRYNSPFANVLVVVVGAIAIAVSFVIGIFAFVALLAAVFVLAAVVGARIWWLGVKVRKGQASAAGHPRPASDGGQTVIEGEYRVVASEKDGDNPSQS